MATDSKGKAKDGKSKEKKAKRSLFHLWIWVEDSA